MAISPDLGITSVDKEIVRNFGEATFKLTYLGAQLKDDIPDFSDVLKVFLTPRSILIVTMMEPVLH